MNLKMAELKLSLEKAGFAKVKTLLSSGNVAFDSKMRSVASIEKWIETALEKEFGRTYHTVVRSTKELSELIECDPYREYQLPADAKRVVTFARHLDKPRQPLPIVREGAQILSVTRREAFSAYVPGPHGPVFMELIKATFGADQTTRTWETVKKCAKG
jgi:uncharacterized protein (DUF1697 family)